MYTFCGTQLRLLLHVNNLPVRILIGMSAAAAQSDLSLPRGVLQVETTTTLTSSCSSKRETPVAAVTVLLRPRGLLRALPGGSISEEILASGAHSPGVVGPSVALGGARHRSAWLGAVLALGRHFSG